MRNILFFSRLNYPHIGGVEKQVKELSNRLVKKSFKVTIVTEKYDINLKDEEFIDGVKIVRFTPKKIKYFGLVYIWLWLFKHRDLIKSADIVHAHSVYIWYWPFRFLYPRKKSYVTFHGWEGIYPIPKKNIFIRKIDALLARKNITISDYVEKHYGIRANKLMYTSVDLPKSGLKRTEDKNVKNIIYVGRLDEDTGLRKIIEAISYLKRHHYYIEFCGDGPLRKDCEKLGKVYGFIDPNPFYQKAFICLSPGHTSILEAFTHKCLVVTTYNNPVKRDYLLMTPFKNWIVVKNSPKLLARSIQYYTKNPKKAEFMIDSAYKWVKTQNWDNATKDYLDLWGFNIN
jgi:glycosyltransferase involved in cell wall biosynthesis